MNIVTVALVAAIAASTLDTSTALTQAKALIESAKHGEALEVLASALDGTSSIRDRDEQKQARTALHFYAAVSASALGRDAEATEHLRSVFALSPTMRVVDEQRYGAHFIHLFRQTRLEVGGPGTFEELYPGFTSFTPRHDGTVDLWENPAIELLGTRREKDAWHDAITSVERDRVRAEFWRVRDRTPGTESNEYREMIARRVAFADATFGSRAERGSMSDRGRVFVVLGTPGAVRKRALRSDERIVAMNRNSIGVESGTIEFWIYTREQLGDLHKQPTIAYRFVTHQGVGENVLQKDGAAMNLLAAAAAAPK